MIERGFSTRISRGTGKTKTKGTIQFNRAEERLWIAICEDLGEVLEERHLSGGFFGGIEFVQDIQLETVRLPSGGISSVHVVSQGQNQAQDDPERF